MPAGSIEVFDSQTNTETGPNTQATPRHDMQLSRSNAEAAMIEMIQPHPGIDAHGQAESE